MLNRFMRDVCKTYASENNVGLPLTAENMLNALTSWFERYYNTLIPRINTETNEWELFNITTNEFEPTGVYAKGEKGEEGKGLEIVGAVETEEDLPTNVDIGTAYSVGTPPNNVLYTYSLVDGEPTWVNQGSLRAVGLGDDTQLIVNPPPKIIYKTAYSDSPLNNAGTMKTVDIQAMNISFTTIANVSDWHSIVLQAGGAKVCLANLDLYGNVMGLPDTNLYPREEDYVNGGSWATFIQTMGYVTVNISLIYGIRFSLNGVVKIRYTPTRLFADSTTTVRDFVEALFTRMKVEQANICYNDGVVNTTYNNVMVTSAKNDGNEATEMLELYNRYRYYTPYPLSIKDSQDNTFTGTVFTPSVVKFNEDFTEEYLNGIRTVSLSAGSMHRHDCVFTFVDSGGSGYTYIYRLSFYAVRSAPFTIDELNNIDTARKYIPVSTIAYLTFATNNMRIAIVQGIQANSSTQIEIDFRTVETVTSGQGAMSLPLWRSTLVDTVTAV